MAFAQVGIVGFDGQIELEALRLFGPPEAAPAVLYACPSVPVGTREFQAEVSWDLPSLASGATAPTDVTVAGTRQGDMAQASLVSSTRFIDLTAIAWTNNTVRVMARNIPGATFDLAAATLSIARLCSAIGRLEKSLTSGGAECFSYKGNRMMKNAAYRRSAVP